MFKELNKSIKLELESKLFIKRFGDMNFIGDEATPDLREKTLL